LRPFTTQVTFLGPCPLSLFSKSALITPPQPKNGHHAHTGGSPGPSSQRLKGGKGTGLIGPRRTASRILIPPLHIAQRDGGSSRCTSLGCLFFKRAIRGSTGPANLKDGLIASSNGTNELTVTTEPDPGLLGGPSRLVSFHLSAAPCSIRETDRA